MNSFTKPTHLHEGKKEGLHEGRKAQKDSRQPTVVDGSVSSDDEDEVALSFDRGRPIVKINGHRFRHGGGRWSDSVAAK